MDQDIAVIVEQTRELLRTAGYPYVHIVSVTPDEYKMKWKVKADVGISTHMIKEVTIDDHTGKVIEYHDA